MQYIMKRSKDEWTKNVNSNIEDFLPMNILSYFHRDDTTYAADNIVMFSFKDERRDDFLIEGVDFYRRAFVSDEDLVEDIKEMGGTRRNRIAEYLPSEGNIKSGDFGEILTYLLFSALFPDYNVKPLRWRWQEDVNRAVHFTDILWLYCIDPSQPQLSDSLMTIEVKTRATSPGKDSTINEAIKGMQKDSVTREGLTLAYMKRQYKRDKQYGEARVVERFERAVNNPYHCDYNAIAIVDSSHLEPNHIAYLDKKLTVEIATWNMANAVNHKRKSVFVVPVTALKQLYEDMYQNVLNS